MPKFKKRPVEVEARQWDGTANNARELIDWILNEGGTARYICSNTARCIEFDGDTPHTIAIDTHEGIMTTGINDYIIKEPFPTDDRKFYPCKPDIFESTYEEVTDAGSNPGA